MNTFLPYPDFRRSAICLDNRRLNKQKLEVYQLLRTINGITVGWKNHPCVKMWKPYHDALCMYGIAICTECVSRCFTDSLEEKFIEMLSGNEIKMPHWLGRDDFHSSHRSNLLRKFPEWYSKFGWTEKDDQPYIWPS